MNERYGPLFSVNILRDQITLIARCMDFHAAQRLIKVKRMRLTMSLY